MLKIVFSFCFPQRRVTHCQKILHYLRGEVTVTPTSWCEPAAHQGQQGIFGLCRSCFPQGVIAVSTPVPAACLSSQGAAGGEGPSPAPPAKCDSRWGGGGRGRRALAAVPGGTVTFPYRKSKIFSQSFETICRAGMWPSDQVLFVFLVHVKLWVWVQHSCPVTSPATQGCCSVRLSSLFPDSSTAQLHQLSQHTSPPFAFEDCICYFRLEVWVICTKCVGSSSSINVTEEAVSSWNLSHFHSQNTTGPAVPLLNIF